MLTLLEATCLKFLFTQIVNLFYYFQLCWVFTAACGLSPAAASRGHALVVGWGLLTAVVPLDAERGL